MRRIKISELWDTADDDGIISIHEEYYLDGKDLEAFDNFMSKLVVTKIMDNGEIFDGK